MNVILKTKGNQPIDERDKKWTESKFAKLGKLVPAEAVVEVTLENMYGPKRGLDKRVIVVAQLPHAKEPFHLEEVATNFRLAATAARNRFERYLKKQHDRYEDVHRKPRKYFIAKLLERFGRKRDE